MGHRFSLILNREVTDQESVTLKEASPADMSFASDTLPTDSTIPVTRIEFVDEVTPTLAEAIEGAFGVVKEIPELSVPGLSVPAQPAVEEGEDGEDDGSVREQAKASS